MMKILYIPTIVIVLLLSSLIKNKVYASSLSDIIQNKESVIIADKKNGKLYVYYALTKLLTSAPALFGKTISDHFDIQDYNFGKPDTITPAGTFKTRKYISTRLHEPVTAIIEGTASLLSIHPVWLGNPEQGRVKRLHTDTAKDNRITNGCINVYPDFYYNVINHIPDGTKVIVLSEQDELINDIPITYSGLQ